jgi:V8-like Glu-specific endopeptidase
MPGRHRGAGFAAARFARVRGRLGPRGLARLILAAALGAGLLVTVLFVPAAPAMARLAGRLAAAAQTLGMRAHAAKVARAAAPAGTSRAVGALFTITPGPRGHPQLGRHFCTATVVDSRSGDLVLTAAHCVSGRVLGQLAFVPEYRDGGTPAGVWPVTKVFVDQTWSATASQDDDVAFLLVHRHGTKASVQSRAGGERMGIGQPAGQLVQVTGYPNRAAAPVACRNRAEAFTATELQFDCAGFADGTSGSALLANVNPLTGLGTVIGVIGGHQQGGDTTSVSYADRLVGEVAALYKTATARP